MEVLNSNELSQALDRCRMYPKYSVGVMFDRAERQKEFVAEMRTTRNTNWSVPRYGMTIRFENGSYIKPIYVNTANGMRGLRFNEILYDGDSFNEDYVNTVFKPMLKSYTIPEFGDSTDVVFEDASLSDFLDTFKINK